MTIAGWRLLWHQQRWELAILIGGCLVLAASMAFVAWQIPVTTEALEACYAEAGDEPLPVACRSLIDWGNLWTTLEPLLVGVGTVLPFLVGLLLGAPLVAREIEKRTAPMAWSLSLSRRRWLAGRAIPIGLLVVASLLLVGQVSDALQAVADRPFGFADSGSRGPIVAARGALMFGMGVTVGLVTGRVLPAILVTALVAIAVFGAIEYGRSQLMRAEAVWIEPGGELDAIAMIYDSRLRDDDTGELMTYEEAYRIFTPEDLNEGDGVPPGMTQLYLTVPPDRYPSIMAREIAALVGLAGAALALGWWLIARRRPE